MIGKRPFDSHTTYEAYTNANGNGQDKKVDEDKGEDKEAKETSAEPKKTEEAKSSDAPEAGADKEN